MTDQTTTGTITTTTTSSSSLWRRQVEALMLTQGGVALADSADASRCYRGLWATPDGARQAFHRAKRVTGAGGVVPEGPCHALLRRATYQSAGAGRRLASLAFDPAVVPPDQLRGWLEERLGPLARFDLDPERPPPDPPRPEPAGAPQSKSGPESQERQGNAPPASAGNGISGSPSDLGDGRDGGGTIAASAVEAARAPPEAADGPGGCTDPSEGAEAPPGPSAAPPAPIAAAPAGGLSAAEQAAWRLQDRLRLNALVQRLRECRPKRVHGVRQLDWDAWEVAARAAAELPSAEWEAWRATIGTAAAGWPPRPPAPPPVVEAQR